jgi:hypothetical protein
MVRPWLVELERTLADESDDADLAIALVVLAAVAGERVRVPEPERRAATRRATLLLAAGGDPSRGLDLSGRAVTAVADDLRTVDRQLALESALAELRVQAEGLPHVSEALAGLIQAPDLAWRAYACALIAEDLGDE